MNVVPMGLAFNLCRVYHIVHSAICLADCGPAVGLGHLRRMLVLAAALRKRGAASRMLITHPSGADLVAGQGFDCGLWDVAAALPQADIVAIDGYGFDDRLALRWREVAGALVLAVDDLAARPVEANVILNHNIYGADLDYRAYRAERFLTGPRYALIDPAFAALAGRPRAKSDRIVVSFGGTDNGDLAVEAARAVLSRDPAVVADIVISPLAALGHAAAVVEAEFPGRAVVRRGASMTGLMAEARLYLGAAGVTLMEAIAAGMDVVACAIADNQTMNIDALKRRSYPAFAHFDTGALADAVLERLAGSVESAERLIDGLGADRVAAELTGLAAHRHGRGRASMMG